jgi:hypothetical protein
MKKIISVDEAFSALHDAQKGRLSMSHNLAMIDKERGEILQRQKDLDIERERLVDAMEGAQLDILALINWILLAESASESDPKV